MGILSIQAFYYSRQLSLKDQYSVDASDVSSILNSASYRMAALDEVTEASAATERTMKNLPQIGTKMGVKDQYCKNSRYILESGLLEVVSSLV